MQLHPKHEVHFIVVLFVYSVFVRPSTSPSTLSSQAWLHIRTDKVTELNNLKNVIVHIKWCLMDEIAPLCGARAARSRGDARGWGGEHPKLTWVVMRWIQKCFAKEKKKEGLKVWTKSFSVVSKSACSYMNSCTIPCCFRAHKHGCRTANFFYTMCTSDLDEYDAGLTRRIYIRLYITERGLNGI